MFTIRPAPNVERKILTWTFGMDTGGLIELVRDLMAIAYRDPIEQTGNTKNANCT